MDEPKVLDAPLPRDLEAERSVLGSILIGGAETLATVRRVLAPNDFAVGVHRTIFGAMVGLVDAGSAIDSLIVRAELQRRGQLDRIGREGEPGASYLVELFGSVPHAENAEHYAKIVAEQSQRRRLIEAAKHVTAAAYDGQGGLADAMAELNEAAGGACRGAAIERVGILEFADLNLPATPYIVNPIVPAGALMGLAGTSKRGKSTLAIHLNYRASAGADFLSYQTVAVPTLYIDGEMADAYRQSIVRQVVAACDTLLEPCDFITKFPRPLTLDFIKEAVSAYAKPGIVVLDSFRALYRPTGEDENSAGYIGTILRALSAWCHESGWTVLIVHHSPKASDRKDEASFSGSSEWGAACDLLWIWDRNLHDETGTLRVSGRIAPVPPLTVRVSPSECQLLGTMADVLERENCRKVLDLLPDSEPGWSASEVKDNAAETDGMGISNVKAALKRLFEDGVVCRAGTGKRGCPFTYWKKTDSARIGQLAAFG